MKLLVVSSAPLIFKESKVFAYSPYVNEMAIWSKYATISFACVEWKEPNGLLISEIPFEIERFFKLADFNIKSKKNIFSAFFNSIANIFILMKAMKTADHIHLRCPGNMALLGCIAQIFFPRKIKTAKYAGNWDKNSMQPLSYRIQKWILSNTFFTKNMQVLVYGEWTNQSKNIKPFFTATYSESDKIPVLKRNLGETIKFVFVGTLSSGKRPLYVLELLNKLRKKVHNVQIDFYGEGTERKNLENYILENNLSGIAFLHGNQNEMVVRNAYQKSHFLVLPSKSEGWPKVVAEAMFWGCVPISSSVSCVPNMLDNGNRGILLSLEIEKDTASIFDLLQNEQSYFEKSLAAENWSRKYTLDTFEAEIKKLLQS